MRRSVCRLVFLGAVVSGCAQPATEPDAAALEPNRLDPRVAPLSQSVDLRLDARQEKFGGSTRIALKVAAPTSSFRFHAQDLTLDPIVLSGADGKPVAVQVEPGADGMILATTATELQPGDYTLEVEFSGSFNTQAVGLYRMEHEGEGYLFTQFEAMDARKAFPCWDEPIYKIPYRLTLRVPQQHLALTNAPIAAETTEDGWRTVEFAETPPLPSYLLALAAGPLETAPLPGMSVPGRVVTVKGQSHLAGLAAEMTPPLLAALEEYFGAGYPYAKLDLIAVPEFWAGAMENPGAITYADSILLADPAEIGVGDRRTFAEVTAHELAHMWFGDVVTMKWWDDLWLNESFASWLGDKIAEEVYPEYGVELAGPRRIRRVFDADARPSSLPIRKPVLARKDVMDGLGLSYGKGRTVLEMVEQWLGSESFRKGVLAYVNAHAWGNAEAADLWNALSEASGADVTAVLESFLDQPGYPLLRVDVDDAGVVTLAQERFLNYGVEAPQQRWVLPVRLAYAGKAGTATRAVLLRGEHHSLGLETEVDWLLPDAGARGYYRWTLPAERILDLAGRAADVMGPRERVAFLGNASALLDAGEIGGDAYLELINGFADDPEPEVVSTLISGLDKVRRSFVPDELTGGFARYVRATLRPALDRFGLQARPGEPEAVTLFRPRLYRWLGDEGQDPDVRRHAARLARAYLSKPDAVDPSLVSAVLEVAAIEGGQDLFDDFVRRFERADSPASRERFLEAVGNFRDEKLQAQALRYALGDAVRPTETFTIPLSLPDTDAASDRAYEWMTSNLDALRSRLPPESLPFLPYLAGGCSVERLAAAQRFFGGLDEAIEGADRTLEKVADQVTDCAGLRDREGAVVAAYLQRVE